MNAAALSDSRLLAAHRAALVRLRDYERACQREGGFLTSDPRTPAMHDAGVELDELEAELMWREYPEFRPRVAWRDRPTASR